MPALRPGSAPGRPAALSFQLIKANLEDRTAVDAALPRHQPRQVVNLAACRYWMANQNQVAYIQSNLGGFGHLLEHSRHLGIEHRIDASRSTKGVKHPGSLYAASKKANELMAIGLFLFSRAMLAGGRIQIFTTGQMLRDFTAVGDIIESLTWVLDKPATAHPSFDPLQPNPTTSWAPHRLFNIGNSSPIPLMAYAAWHQEFYGL